MAEEKEAEGKDEEKKEDEEESESESESESDEEGGQSDPRIPDDLSNEARSWCRRYFNGDLMYGRYFEKAKDRSPLEIEEMKKKRTWQIKISNIKFLNQHERKDPFLRINVGWDFEPIKCYKPGPRKQDKEGKFLPRESEIRTFGDVGAEFLTEYITNVEKEQIAEYATEINAKIKMSYFDLYSKSVNIEFWDWNCCAPHEYIARGTKPLMEIATGNVSVTLPIQHMVKGKRRSVLQDVGQVFCTLVFQEVCRYELSFINWQAKLRRKYLPNKLRGYNFPYIKMRLGRVWATSQTAKSKAEYFESDREDQILTKPFKNIGSLRYFGTRIGLEQEALKVWVYDKTGVLPGSATLIGAGDLPLLGAANGGTLSARLCWEMPKSKGKIEVERLHDSGEVRGSVDVDSSSSPLWREFAQTGDLNPPELRLYPPFWYSYLCIKIVSASNLIGADDSGVSDPYFVCSWGDSKMQTAVHMGTTDPYYDETLYFRIRSFKPDMPTAAELRKLPCIMISAFDHDEAGVSQALGTTKLFIHEITQVPTPTKMVIPLRSTSGAMFLPVDVVTRVLRKTLPLTGLPPGVTSSVKVEAFFLAPITRGRQSSPNLSWNDIGGRRRGDIYEPNLEKRKISGDFLILPEYNEKEVARSEAQCFCYHPLLTIGEHRQSQIEQGGNPPVLGDDVDGSSRMVCPGSFKEAMPGGGSNRRNMCDTLKKAYDLIEKNYDEDERFVSFRESEMESLGENAVISGLLRGYNFNRETKFLPTLCCPIAPPRTLFEREDCEKPKEKWERDGSVGHSELEGIICVSSQKPNTSYKLATMVRAMEFCDHGNQLIWGENVGGRDAWIEPPQFLETRSADIKSHVLLLESFLLGIKVDAYVCIGTVKDIDPKTGEIKGPPKVHVWLMTRESDSKNCRAPYYDDDSPVPECDPDGLDTPLHSYGSVKFWEITSSGRLDTDALPNRWGGRDDLKAYIDATRTENKPKRTRAVKEETEITEAAQATDSDSSDDDNFDGPPKEEDMLNNPAYLSSEKNVDTRTDVDKLFETTAGLDGHWGRPDQKEIMARRNEAFNVRHERLNAKAAAKSKAEAEAAAASLEATYIARTQWIQKDEHTRKWTSNGQLPYNSLVAVFNHKNVWLNIQPTTDPFVMSYDLHLGTRAGWQPVVNQGYGKTNKGIPRTWKGTTVFPFYEAPVLAPSISSERAQQLEESITLSVMAYLTNARDAANLPTKWAKNEIGPVLADVLTAEQTLRLLPKILKNGWDKDDESRKQKWIIDSRGAKAYLKYFKARQKLHQSTPFRYTYHLGLASIVSVDDNDVGRIVSQKALWHIKAGRPDVPLHLLAFDGREVFCYSTKLQCFPGNVNSCRIGLMVVVPVSVVKED